MEPSRLKLDDFRRCIGVRGEVGIADYLGPQLIVPLEPQPSNRFVSWWSVNSGVSFAGVAAGSAAFLDVVLLDKVSSSCIKIK